jgi:hypothetical protein
MEPEDYCLRVAEDSAYDLVRPIAGEAVGIEEALVFTHSSRYNNLSMPKTQEALSFLLAFHFFT